MIFIPRLVKEMMEQGLFQRDATITFQQPTFVRISLPQVPLMKVTGISTTIDIRRTVFRRVGLPNFVDFVLRNLSDEALDTSKGLGLRYSRVQIPNQRRDVAG